MDIKINQQIIKELCGSVSFKRGEAYYRAGKVTIHEHSADLCRASVKGIDDFHVTIEKDNAGRIQPSCSCPTLGNFSKSCQHVAAVLLALAEVKSSGGQQLSQGILTLFQDKPIRKSRHQLHFEKREVLDVQFTLKTCMIGNTENLFGVELAINQTKISAIRAFLQHVQLGEPYSVSPTFTFDPNAHCFDNEVDAVIHQLIRVARDELALPNDVVSQDVLLIPPSAWKGLMSLLAQVPVLIVKQNGQMAQQLRLADGVPPLQFNVEEVNGKYQMTVKGFEQLVLFDAYYVVLHDGAVFQLDSQDFDRLMQLQQMLVAPNNNYVPIPYEQMDMFLNKVVPGLRKIGQVRLSQHVIAEMQKTPLVAKLYLDRLKNRLLAGLEFHYEHVIIQPLEAPEQQLGPMIIRDYKKEQEILELMEESGFTKTDGGYFMQNEELEYDFLYHVLPHLQPLAQIYATTAVRNRLVKNNHFPKIAVKVKKERTNWLEFKFEMDGISHKQVKEILQALEIKQKYYRLPNDSLLSLETKEMEEIRRFLLAGPVQDDDFEATLNMPIVESLKFLDLIGDSEIFTPEESFRQFIDQLLHPETLDFDVPPSLQGILRDYQKQGFKWMKQLAS